MSCASRGLRSITKTQVSAFNMSSKMRDEDDFASKFEEVLLSDGEEGLAGAGGKASENVPGDSSSSRGLGRKRPSRLALPKNVDSGVWYGEGKGGSGEKTVALSKEVMEMTDMDAGVFEEEWEMDTDIGKGSTSTVYKCYRKVKGKVLGMACAAKVVDKKRLGFGRRKDAVLAHIRTEVEVLRKIGSHPCIVKLVAAYESESQIHIVTELMEGGELFDYICEKEQLTEAEAMQIVRRIASALAYLHCNGIIHRDLKPENLLLKTKGDVSEIKVIDFGFSKITARTKSFLGTQGYLAPEMMNMAATGEGYTMAIDIWALGICVYALLSGYLPFDDDLDDEEPTYEVQFPQEQWGKISPEAKDFIRRLLVVDPEKRLTADQVMKQPWLAKREGLGTTFLDSPTAMRSGRKSSHEKPSRKDWRSRLRSIG